MHQHLLSFLAQDEEQQQLIQAGSGSQQLSTAASGSLQEAASQQALSQQQQQQPARVSLTSTAYSSAAQQPAALPANSMTVSTYLASSQRAPHPGNSFRVFCAVLAMLQPLHAQGIASGCVRPSHLVLHSTGHVTTHPNLPSTAAEHGLYASPEQAAAGVSTPASDIFSLGMLFFELLVKNSDQASPGTLSDVVQQVVASTGQSSSPKAAFLLAMLNPEPSKRPAVAQILAGQLLSMLHSTICSRPVERAQPLPEHHVIRFPRLGQQFRQQQQHQRQQQRQQQQQQALAVVEPAVPPQRRSMAQADAALLEDFLKVMSKRTAASAVKTEHQLSLLDQDIQEVNAKLLSMVHQTPSELLQQTSAPQLTADSPKLQLQHPASRKRQRSWETASASQVSPDPHLALIDSTQQKSERVEQSWKNAKGAFRDLEDIFFKRREAESAPASPSFSDASDADHMPSGLTGLSGHLTDFATDLANYSCYSRLQVCSYLSAAIGSCSCNLVWLLQERHACACCNMLRTVQLVLTTDCATNKT